MKLNRTLGLCLIFIVAVSFATVVLKHKGTVAIRGDFASSSKPGITNGNHYSMLTFPTLATEFSFLLTKPLYTDVAEKPTQIFSNSTRLEIYNFVKANPGFQFRAVCSALGLSIGLAQFHLGVLVKAGLVSFFRDGKYKRFFESKRFSKKQMSIISLLRHETAGTILRTLLNRGKVSHGELLQELSITSQGLTWQMKYLKEIQLVAQSKEKRKLRYSIQCASAQLLSEMAKLLQPT